MNKKKLLLVLVFVCCNPTLFFATPKPKIVGLVPVRNEELLIEPCLRALAQYTDALVVLDDASQDKTLSIVTSLAHECNIEKILHKKTWYRDEPGDRNTLLETGREIGGTHFIVMDADEMFTANCTTNNMLRNTILSLQPGDKLKLHWIRLWRSTKHFRTDGIIKDFVFCDDGECSYESGFIHTLRTPKNLTGTVKTITEYTKFGVLHFQAADWRNMQIRQAWYRCLERIRKPHLPAQEINKGYIHQEDETTVRLHPAPQEWFDGYDFYDPGVFQQPEVWREQQVLDWFDRHGKDHFAGLDIWHIDWGAGLQKTKEPEEKPQEYRAWLKRHQAQEGDTVLIKPIDLVKPERFNLMAHYIYAQQREQNIQSNWAHKLYDETIHVTNNYSEGYPVKNGIQEFIDSFHATLDSIKRDGFDPSTSRIPIDYRKCFLNGTHRASACLVYHPDKPIPCTYILDLLGKPHDCTAQTLQKKNNSVSTGLSEKYLDAMALQYCKLKKNTFVAIVFPCAPGHDELIQKMLNAYGTIVYEKEITLKNNGPLQFIRTIYEGEPFVGSWNNNFSLARGKAARCFPEQNQDKPMRVYLFECDHPEKLRECKERIRALFNIGWDSIHINDTHNETVLIARTVFNKNSIHWLNHSKIMEQKRFELFFEAYRKWLKDNVADVDCFCVDTSSVLAVYGLRDCANLNYVHHGYGTMESGTPYIGDHNHHMEHHPTTKDDIVFNPDNHFYYKGLKFASLDIVKKIKTKRNETKDQRDVWLINQVH